MRIELHRLITASRNVLHKLFESSFARNNVVESLQLFVDLRYRIFFFYRDEVEMVELDFLELEVGRVSYSLFYFL